VTTDSKDPRKNPSESQHVHSACATPQKSSACHLHGGARREDIVDQDDALTLDQGLLPRRDTERAAQVRLALKRCQSHLRAGGMAADKCSGQMAKACLMRDGPRKFGGLVK